MPTRFLQSSTFRLALTYMLFFSISVLILLGFIYWSTVTYLTSQTDATIELEIEELAARYRALGLTGIAPLINNRVAKRPTGSSVYLLVDRNFRPLLGNMSRWPKSKDLNKPLAKDVKTGWLDFNLETLDQSDPESHRVRARIFLLHGDYRLLVGKDVSELEATKKRISYTLLWGLGIMFLLGGLGSMMMSKTILRRIEVINDTSREIMSGDLSRRIPSKNSGDDFDVLADNLNRMLDQIESLMESVRRVSDNIAHDLRTPLASLRTRLEELQLDVDRPETDRESIEIAVNQADGLLNTFNALLRIARIEAEKNRENFSSVDITALINDVTELYEPLIDQKQQELHTAIASAISIQGDRDLLFQAIANLLDNAIKYTPEKGEIDIELAAKENKGIITISDNGPGIPDQMKEKVFQRFFRLENSRTTSGNGLGMSLVEAVIKLHHMTIRLDDNYPGLKVAIEFSLEQHNIKRINDVKPS